MPRGQTAMRDVGVLDPRKPVEEKEMGEETFLKWCFLCVAMCAVKIAQIGSAKEVFRRCLFVCIVFGRPSPS